MNLQWVQQCRLPFPIALSLLLRSLQEYRAYCIMTTGISKIVKAKIVQLEEDDGSGPTKFDT